MRFQPAWWLPGPHLQTLWPKFFRRRITISLRRERFELEDGDFVDVDWAGKNEGPIVILLHGLEGSIESHYAKGMLHAIVQHGWRGAFLHFRSCSGESNRLPQAYHSGETRDIAAVVNAISQRENKTPIAAIGFSLGGNVLLKWLGESGDHNPLCAAVAISVPFELEKSADRLQQGFSRVYQWHLLKCLREKLHLKMQYLNEFPFSIPPLKTLRTLYEFDNCITAPLHGFRDARDYYMQSSSRQYLKQIRVPTLLLQAKNDPFMTETSLPTQADLSPTVTLELTKTGGHVGFISGKSPWRVDYWLEKRAPMFLNKHISY